MLLHLRVAPGFGIAVEARSRPELHSIPVIMGGPAQSRGTVREANFPAQARGVQPGLTTLAQAHQYCPEGLFLTPDDACYAAVWNGLCAILRRYTPLVEPQLETGGPVGQGQAMLDLSGCPGAQDDHATLRLAGEIMQAVRTGTGIAPWLGLATNRLVAELASRDVDDRGITVVPAGRERAFLADLPLTTLPEIDARLALTFQVLGLRTIGQFAALPRSAVRQRFGALGERLHAWSRGIDSRPIVPPREDPAVRVHAECDEGTIEDAIATLHRLAGECADELQRRRLAGTLLTLTLTWSAGSNPPAKTHASSVAMPLSGLPSVAPSVALPLSGQGSAAAEHERSAPQPPSIPTQSTVEQTFPIAYRIHSMLPQPGIQDPSRDYQPSIGSSPVPRFDPPAERPAPVPLPTPAVPFTTLTALVRTPITEMPPLFERARDLFLRHWQRDHPHSAPTRLLQAIELAVSSFEQPVQLAFAELNRCLKPAGRLEGIGLLRGMDPARRRAFEQAEEALATRYGDTSFRRLAHLDPANILTERRFRWEEGVRSQVSGVRTSSRYRKSDT